MHFKAIFMVSDCYKALCTQTRCSLFSNRISDSQLGCKRSYILLHHLLRQLLSLRISCFHPLVRSRGCPRGDLLKWAGVTLATKWTYRREDLARAKRSRPTRGPALLYGRSIDGRTHTHMNFPSISYSASLPHHPNSDPRLQSTPLPQPPPHFLCTGGVES